MRRGTSFFTRGGSLALLRTSNENLAQKRCRCDRNEIISMGGFMMLVGIAMLCLSNKRNPADLFKLICVRRFYKAVLSPSPSQTYKVFFPSLPPPQEEVLTKMLFSSFTGSLWTQKRKTREKQLPHKCMYGGLGRKLLFAQEVIDVRSEYDNFLCHRLLSGLTTDSKITATQSKWIFVFIHLSSLFPTFDRNISYHALQSSKCAASKNSLNNSHSAFTWTLLGACHALWWPRMLKPWFPGSPLLPLAPALFFSQ